MLLEKDEAVLNGKAMRSDEKLTATGTPSEIASALNSRYGGVSWTAGATIGAPKWITAKPVQINPQLPRIMAAGGTVSNTTAKATSEDVSFDEMLDVLKDIATEQKNHTEEIKNMKTKLHAVVSIKEYREEEKKYDAARQASGMA